uniref:Actin-related protein 2/3 complex subunit 5 n=1 Tax=Mus spicilegus TaxID=10103 RepID=A0A8C6G4U0_MUSSI
MSKNTVSLAHFWKVYVDEYNKNKFVDKEDGGDGQGNMTTALQAALTAPPPPPLPPHTLTLTQTASWRCLSLLKLMILKKSLDKNSNSVDFLMKYIYKGFESPSDNSSAVLLQWHEKALAAARVGSIRKAIDLFELMLYPANSLKLFIRFRSSLVEFLGSLIYTIISSQKVIF